MSKDIMNQDFENHKKREGKRKKRGVEIPDPDTGYNLIKKEYRRAILDFDGYIKYHKIDID